MVHRIDLTFGYLLSTQTSTRPASAAAVAAMNVALPRASQEPPAALAAGMLLHSGPAGYSSLVLLDSQAEVKTRLAVTAETIPDVYIGARLLANVFCNASSSSGL